MLKGFTRNKEDFTCGNCGTFTEGNGYTNHCHECFYSKHVDIAPGDRAADCGGLMKPVSVSGPTNALVITQTCLSCGFTRNNKVQERDNMDKLVQLVTDLNSER